jgi:hypothetical protein
VSGFVSAHFSGHISRPQTAYIALHKKVKRHFAMQYHTNAKSVIAFAIALA